MSFANMFFAPEKNAWAMIMFDKQNFQVGSFFLFGMNG